MKVYAGIRTIEQLEAVMKDDSIDAVLLPPALFCDHADRINKEMFVRLPEVLRQNRMQRIEELLSAGIRPFGFVIENPDEIGLLKAYKWQGEVIGGEFLYVYNAAAVRFFASEFRGISFLSPAELTLNELSDLQKQTGRPFIYKVYGRQLLMTTAQCQIKNYAGCRKTDRNAALPQSLKFGNEKKDSFYVCADCEECCNRIYHGKPTYMIDKLAEIPSDQYLLDLTVENSEETKKVLSKWNNRMQGGSEERRLFTRGHFYRPID